MREKYSAPTTQATRYEGTLSSGALWTPVATPAAGDQHACVSRDSHSLELCQLSLDVESQVTGGMLEVNR